MREVLVGNTELAKQQAQAALALSRGRHVGGRLVSNCAGHLEALTLLVKSANHNCWA